MISTMILMSLLGPIEQVRALPFLGKPCASNGYTKGMADLIHNVAIMPNDQRFGIIEGGPKFGLSNDEVTWLRSIVGEVRCTNAKNQRLKYRSTGVIIDSTDQVLTNAHQYLQKDGKVNFDSCIFISKSDPPIRRQLQLNQNKALFGTEDPEEHNFKDYAIAKLNKPIPGVVPLQRVKTLNGLSGRDLIVVSAQMARMKRPIGVNEPIIQKCIAQKSLISPVTKGSIVYTDCSSAIGGSGSINLVRSPDGKLEGVGISTRTSDEDKDNQPYSYEDDNFDMVLGFDGQFGKDLDHLSVSSRTQ